MHKLAIYALLAVVPFTGLRMMCVDAPEARAVERPVQPAGAEAVVGDHECQDMCPLVDTPGRGSTCLFVPDAASVLLVVVPIAIPPSPVAFDVRFVSVGLVPEFSTAYLAPTPTPQTPPPRA
jgi:hypothetical protein